jgi:threonine synthase
MQSGRDPAFETAWTRRCGQCGQRYEYSVAVWRCCCGGPLEIETQTPFAEPDGSETGIWKYWRALPPVPQTFRVSLGEADTPLVAIPGLPGDVRAKLEFLSPTGSFKDRGTAVVVSRLRHLGVAHLVEDSSGNAGASIAAYCAAAGIQCTIYVPDTASKGKLTQMRIHGASVVSVPGPRPAATEAAISAAGASYYANHVLDPYFFEGTKTAAFEIIAQLCGTIPARVILPVGQGTMLLGLARGFRQLSSAGQLSSMPKLVAVQSDACAPLYEVFHRNLGRIPEVAVREGILAEGIATASPLRWQTVIEVIRQSNGEIIRVPDSDVRDALFNLGRLGLFVEPTAATVFAAMRQLAVRKRELDGITILMLTGLGLKAGAVVDRWLDATTNLQHEG